MSRRCASIALGSTFSRLLLYVPAFLLNFAILKRRSMPESILTDFDARMIGLPLSRMTKSLSFSCECASAVNRMMLRTAPGYLDSWDEWYIHFAHFLLLTNIKST